MKKRIITAGLFLIGLGIGTLTSNVKADDGAYQEMYRLYNRNTGEHFYTGSLAERKSLVTVGWLYEGIGWYAPQQGAPVYRLYNSHASDHHYTTSSYEKDQLIKVGWSDEGIGWYSTSGQSGMKLYRAYNPQARTGTHNYTANLAEQQNLIQKGWKDEGVAWHGVNKAIPTPPPTSADDFISLSKAESERAESELIRLINSYRQSKGLNALKTADKIYDMASVRARDMSILLNRKDMDLLLSHRRPDGTPYYTAAKEVGLTDSYIGENIAYTSGFKSGVQAAAELFNFWVHSDSHNKNMLSPNYNYVAFGVYADRHWVYSSSVLVRR